MIKGKNADFNPLWYFVNADGFIVCHLNGKIVDIKAKDENASR